MGRRSIVLNRSRRYIDTDIASVLSPQTWQWIKPEVQKARRILEIGVGPGILLYNLKKTCKGSVYGLDLSFNCCKIAKHLVNKTSVVCANALNIPFPDNSFDIIFCLQTIEHVDDYALAQEVFRLLKKGGFFIVSSVLKKRGAIYFRRSKHMQEFALREDHLREYRSEQELCQVLVSRGFVCPKSKVLKAKYSLLDPLVRLLCRISPFTIFKEIYANNFFVFLRKILRITIARYYVIEVIARK